MESDQERQFVRRAKAGDRAAFSALADRYWGPVRAWLAGLTGREHLAEDLTQDAFLKAWAALPRLAADETFRVWLFRIARNEFLAYRRSPKALPPEALPDASDAAPGPVAAAMTREADAALRAAVARLPEAYRETYLLWTHDALPYPEVARVLGTTEETARWRVCQARKLLVKALEPYLDPSPP